MYKVSITLLVFSLVWFIVVFSVFVKASLFDQDGSSLKSYYITHETINTLKKHMEKDPSFQKAKINGYILSIYNEHNFTISKEETK